LGSVLPLFQAAKPLDISLGSLRYNHKQYGSRSSIIPMTLADFTSPGLIIPHLLGHNVAAVLEELSQALAQEDCVVDRLTFYSAALNREILGSTDMQSGMAFPHARLPELKRLCFAFGRSEAPLAWAAYSPKHVRAVFLFAIPETAWAEYLLLVSGLARLGKEFGLVEKLQTARETTQILEVFRDVNIPSGSTSDTMAKPSSIAQDPAKPVLKTGT
jgi:nitrogen PTS system EIIA component